MGISRDKLLIFGYFLGVILLGSLLLKLPGAWQGQRPLSYIDSLFTSTSAVCVTGLNSVDTSLYSRFGQTVIAFLIQFGGLGLITFVTVYTAMPKTKISLVNRGIIKDYYIDEVDYDPKRIVKHIVLTTLVIETIGTLLLYVRFRSLKDGLFVAAFHSISAFCNAGFSTFSNNLESYVADPLVSLTVAGLIVLGGIGFMVMSDVGECMSGKKKRLSSHSRIAIGMTVALIVSGALLFLFLEWNHAMKGLTPGAKILASIFQSVTPRTAGFDTIPQNRFSDASILITMLLMFIGASPASTGGGIKTTTFFVLIAVALRGVDERGRLPVDRRSVSSATIIKAVGIVGKSALILLISATAVLTFERGAVISGKFGLVEVLFEVISALATVGLSQGITAGLAVGSKLVLILTMFAGRVGLFAMALNSGASRIEHYVDLPDTNLIVG
jgi:trk system potassium uptake protein TrkH